MMIHCAVIEHKFGSNLYLAFTKESLDKKLADFCRDWWAELSRIDEDLPDSPDQLENSSNAEIVSAYFESRNEYGFREFLTRYEPQEVEE